MGIFLDTGFLFALKFKKDPNCKRALEILEEISQKKYGSEFTSDYIIDELMTLTWNRTSDVRLISQIWELISPESHICHTLQVTLEEVPLIYEKFSHFLEKGKTLSFTDCSNLLLMEKFNIKYLASFDTHFNGLTARIY